MTEWTVELTGTDTIVCSYDVEAETVKEAEEKAKKEASKNHSGYSWDVDRIIKYVMKTEAPHD